MIKKFKKAFTLIELLAVIIILGIILIIVVPQFFDIFETTRIKAFINNNGLLLNAVELYINDNEEIFNLENGETIEVSLETLTGNNYITTIKSPFGDNYCTGYVLITKIEGGYSKTPNINCYEDINSKEEDKFVGFWKLDNNLLDYIGTNNAIDHGSLLSYISGKQAFEFNGIDDFVEINDHPLIKGKKTISVFLWIYSRRTGDSIYAWETNQPIIHKQLDRSKGCWGLSITSSNNLTWYAQDNGEDYMLYSGNDSIELNGWTHIGFTLDWLGGNDNELTLYINGRIAKRETTVRNTASANTISNLNLARFNYEDNFFDGFIRDLRIYDRRLHDKEVRLLYESTK